MLTFSAMNTEFLVAGLDEADAAWVKAWVKEAEGRFSRFESQSELARLNRAAGQWVPVSEGMEEILSRAVAFWEETGGIFSPFLEKEMVRLGYNRSFEETVPLEDDRSFREAARLGNDRSGEEAVHAPGKPEPVTEGRQRDDRPLHWDPKGGRMQVGLGWGVDLGGFAKGWTAQKAADHFQCLGRPGGLIDAGGDIALWGLDPEGLPWCVGIAHPFEREKDLAVLEFSRPAAMATSSVLKRRWWQGGEERHHLIDPRTGQPAAGGLVQATVVADDLAVAEVYAKTLLILGPEEGPPFLQARRPQLAWAAVDREGRTLRSGGWEKYCYTWEWK